MSYIIKFDELNFEVWKVGFASEIEIKNQHKRIEIFKEVFKKLSKEHPYLK